MLVSLSSNGWRGFFKWNCSPSNVCIGFCFLKGTVSFHNPETNLKSLYFQLGVLLPVSVAFLCSVLCYTTIAAASEELVFSL